MNPLDRHIHPDTNLHQGLPVPDITMCSEHCPNSKLCRRHPNSGTKPSERQSWAKFNPYNCQSYWPVPHVKKETK